MSIAQIEEQIQKLSRKVEPESFIYDLLGAYGKPKASLTRLQNGTYNLSKSDGEILWKKNLLFKVLSDGNALYGVIDSLRKSEPVAKHGVRFVVVTDYKTLLAVDTKTGDTLDTPISELGKHFDFFLPWAGFEKTNRHTENPADIKAAERMAKLYDEIRKDNPIKTARDLHALNIFLSRLLFCFFAEDTEIFEKGAFTNSIASYTADNGSDLAGFLDRLFTTLNVEDHKNFPKYLASFPYVNGGLFAERHSSPEFSRKSRKMILECGELDWSAINPDIFGSMIQAVVHPDQRGGMGMHYTSVTNIMKVIEPLFLNELREEFEANRGNVKRLEKLLAKMRRIRIFDPACGSGNFLVIAYKQLRKLEMDIFLELQALNPQQSLPLPSLRLSQFCGIELDDFAHEVAILSLWLAEHQMNLAFKKVFGHVKSSLPLKDAGNVVRGNATQVDWSTVCPATEDEEVFVLGNPPYLGARFQEAHHKEELKTIFDGAEEYKDSDYVSCWFIKAAEFLQNRSASYAFVTTNSITQGEQVGCIWPRILGRNLEIGFAHQSFKWTNNAKGQAAVICVVIGVRHPSNRKKLIYTGPTRREVDNISPYLTAGPSIIVHAAKRPLNGLPRAVMGNMARDGGNLILSSQEKKELVEKFPTSAQFLKRLYGAQEYLKGIERWCLWISDEERPAAERIPPIRDRIEKVLKFRKASDAKTTRGYASIPHKFAQRSPNNGSFILIPRTSSERRMYIPFGFFDESAIVSDAAHAVFDAQPWLFGLISSRMHMAWVKAVAGRLKSDYRYSAEICYNTFPVPELSERQKATISSHVLNILAERERHSEKTVSHLYDPEKMPKPLLEAHEFLDKVIDGAYRGRPFLSDEDRLEHLFGLYVAMSPSGEGQEETDAEPS